MENVKIFTDKIEDRALHEIEEVSKHPAFVDEKIRIMPDVHSGMGCVIGFTSTMSSNKIIPNLIGVDIGCGMLTTALSELFQEDRINLDDLDAKIKKEIPCGFNVNNGVSKYIEEKFKDKIYNVCKRIGDLDKFKYHLKSLGSLGSGNHFLEMCVGKDDNNFFVIHSGSRNFGHKIATYYQRLAKKTCTADVSADLKYLEGENAYNYLKDMKVAQRFASLNREIINAKLFVDTPHVHFETVHNYISDDNIIRKGAVSAKQDELLLIPLNMRDGSILAKGKGNADWNYSAPHGAGRVMSRTQAKKTLSLDAFKNEMKDIYTTSVCESTLDEAPASYKPKEDIINNISETVEIIDILKPIYNFKAH